MFLDKVFNVPLWIKQVMYIKLAEEMKKYDCEEFLKNNGNNMFSTFVPTITYKGKVELAERKCGLDNNIYNFLQCCIDCLSILEISVNTFLSIEEVAKYFEFCLEQNFVRTPETIEVLSMAGFISGKLRIGEYFKQIEVITDDDLKKAVTAYKHAKIINPETKFAEILIKLELLKKSQLKHVLKLKEESQKRFILDYNAVPSVSTQHSSVSKKYEEEIDMLKKENIKLRQKLLQLLSLVKKDV